MLSLNDCLETGAALENLLCGILIRARFKVAALCGDFSKGISSDVRLTLTLIFGLCTKVSLGPKRRSQSNRSYLIHKACVFLMQSPFILEGTTSKKLHREVSCSSYWNEWRSVGWRSDYWWWKLWAGGSITRYSNRNIS